MSHPPLTISRQLELDLSDPHSLTLRYPGDVHLSQTFGRPLAGVFVGGDLTMDLPEVTGTCACDGVLATSSDVDAIRLTGRELHLSGGEIRARALSATERILIGPCKLKVDVIIAPVVHIHPEARGRVTVVECRNDRGPTKIRGEFSLTEYEENFGGAMEFLAGRGVQPLPKNLDIREIVERPYDLDRVEVQATEEPEELDALDFVDLEPIEDIADEDSFDGVSALPEDALEDEDDPATEITALPEDFDDDDTLNDEDVGIIEPTQGLPPRAATPPPPPPRSDAPRTPQTKAWFLKLDALVTDIERAYDRDLPDPIRVLRSVVDSRQTEQVTHRLDAVWTDTVKHHRQARTPVDPRVTHRFRVLSDLVEQQP